MVYLTDEETNKALMKMRIKTKLWRIYYWLFTNRFDGMKLKDLLVKTQEAKE